MVAGDMCRKFARLRIDAVNHALADIPEDKVRFHLCRGSRHGPHVHDLPFERHRCRPPIPAELDTGGRPP